MHVDTVNTHVVSAIINVDQQLDEEVSRALVWFSLGHPFMISIFFQNLYCHSVELIMLCHSLIFLNSAPPTSSYCSVHVSSPLTFLPNSSLLSPL